MRPQDHLKCAICDRTEEEKEEEEEFMRDFLFHIPGHTAGNFPPKTFTVFLLLFNQMDNHDTTFYSNVSKNIDYVKNSSNLMHNVFEINVIYF